MRDAKSDGFFTLLKQLDSDLKPHIHLGPVRFSWGKGAEVIHDPDEETRSADIRIQRPVTLEEIKNEIRKLQTEQATGFLWGKTIPRSQQKKSVPAGSVITSLRRPLSLAELTCKELPPSTIRRFITKTQNGTLTPFASKQFENDFLKALRRVINRELTQAIQSLPVATRGKAARISTITAIGKEMEKSCHKNKTAKQIAAEKGFTERTVWRYFRHWRNEKNATPITATAPAKQ